MRILFTNDDGVFSQGLRALLLAFAQEGNELYVSAPDAERSGASHSFTMFMPLRAQQFLALKMLRLTQFPARPWIALNWHMGTFFHGQIC